MTPNKVKYKYQLVFNYPLSTKFSWLLGCINLLQINEFKLILARLKICKKKLLVIYKISDLHSSSSSVFRKFLLWKVQFLNKKNTWWLSILRPQMRMKWALSWTFKGPPTSFYLLNMRKKVFHAGMWLKVSQKTRKHVYNGKISNF